MTATTSAPVGHRDAWLHAASAAAAGALLGAMTSQLAVAVLFGLLWVAPVAIAVAGLAFGWLGARFLHRGAGWRLAATALVWTPAVLAGVVLQVQQSGGELRASSWLPPALGGAAAGVTALAAHRGSPRRIAGLAVATAVVALVPVVIGASERRHEAEVLAAQQALGSTLRPEVVSVPGYFQASDSTIAGDGSDALVTAYVRHDGRPTPPIGFRFAVVTASPAASPCGPDLLRVGASGQAEPQRTCRRVAGGWRRTSEHGVEFVRRADGKTVRVLAPTGTSTALLERAARTAHPMDDRFYRHLLFGEQGQYVRELDGLR